MSFRPGRRLYSQSQSSRCRLLSRESSTIWGIDENGNWLLVAPESAHQVLVFDLKSGKYVRSIPDIQTPRAIFVREDRNRIYITDGGAGALSVFDGRTYALLESIPLKLDADSISYDPASRVETSVSLRFHPLPWIGLLLS